MTGNARYGFVWTMLWGCVGCSSTDEFVPPRGVAVEQLDPTEGCSDLSCDNEIRISFVSSVVEPGRYEVSLSSADISSVCTFVIMGTPRDCDGEDFCVSDGECEGAELVSVSRAAIGVAVAAQRTLSVQVKRNGARLIDTELRPNYRDYWPNGPDCQPSCKLAQVQLELGP